jgi:KipI family sensor histidine kinase inhibitor
VSTVRPAGRRGVLIELDSLAAVHAARAAVLRARPDGLEDLVPGYWTLLAIGTPSALAAVEAVATGAGDARADAAAGSAPPVVTLDVVYDGPDLDEVGALTGLTTAEVVARHAGPVYTVAFLGFSPGFPYLIGLDPALHVPRLPTPRTSVPAGAVAIAGSQAGIYPRPSPGGWRLLGRTDAVLFDPDRRAPARLAPGDRVRFSPVHP